MARQAISLPDGQADTGMYRNITQTWRHGYTQSDVSRNTPPRAPHPAPRAPCPMPRPHPPAACCRRRTRRVAPRRRRWRRRASRPTCWRTGRRCRGQRSVPARQACPRCRRHRGAAHASPGWRHVHGSGYGSASACAGCT